jgi:hypothetical protein
MLEEVVVELFRRQVPWWLLVNAMRHVEYQDVFLLPFAIVQRGGIKSRMKPAVSVVSIQYRLSIFSSMKQILPKKKTDE